jgi:hypothetical protein
MQKPLLFIGSSAESKWIADKIKTSLSQVVDVKIWDENIFYLDEHTMESLRKNIIRSDYALFIIYPDDKIIKRDKEGYTGRDNVLFELGLFIGSHGIKRTFILTINDIRQNKLKNVQIPNYLSNNTRLDIALTDDQTKNQKDIQSLCGIIMTNIKKEEKDLWHIPLFPSTPLAIGYFKNFILQVCPPLLSISDFKIGNNSYDLTGCNFKFYIVLPDELSDTSLSAFFEFINEHKFERAEIDGKTRKFSVYVNPSLKNGKILLYDFTTTLLAAEEAIKLSYKNNTNSVEIESIKNREIRNFEKVLQYLLKEDERIANCRENIEITYASKLNITKPK